jgi:hypothetical protein
LNKVQTPFCTDRLLKAKHDIIQADANR